MDLLRGYLMDQPVKRLIVNADDMLARFASCGKRSGRITDHYEKGGPRDINLHGLRRTQAKLLVAKEHIGTNLLVQLSKTL